MPCRNGDPFFDYDTILHFPKARIRRRNRVVRGGSRETRRQTKQLHPSLAERPKSVPADRVRAVLGVDQAGEFWTSWSTFQPPSHGAVLMLLLCRSRRRRQRQRETNRRSPAGTSARCQPSPAQSSPAQLSAPKPALMHTRMGYPPIETWTADVHLPARRTAGESR